MTLFHLLFIIEGEETLVHYLYCTHDVFLFPFFTNLSHTKEKIIYYLIKGQTYIHVK